MAIGRAIKQWATEAQAYACGASIRLRKVGYAPRFFRQAGDKTEKAKGFIRGSLVSEWTRANAWVFANVGRSIPPPATDLLKETEAKELADWDARLFDAQPAILDKDRKELLEDLTAWVAGRIHSLAKRLPDVERELDIRLNPSACLECSRAKGGAYEYYKRAAKALKGPGSRIPIAEFEQHPTPRASATAEYPAGQWLPTPDLGGNWYTRIQEDGLGVLHPTKPLLQAEAPVDTRIRLLKSHADDISLREQEKALENESLPMRPVVLPERGMKMRIATMSPAWAVVRGQRINRMLLSLLKTARCHSHALLGKAGVPQTIVEGVKRFGGHRDFVITSADLSAASDFIPHDVAAAVWRGVVEGLGKRLGDADKVLGYQLLGPMHLEGQPERVSNRGILMGLPLTWPVLSLLNEYAASVGMKNPGEPSSKGCFSVCGDDMIAAWTTTKQRTYYENLEKLGLVLNRYKTYESPTGGVFIEELYQVSDRTRWIKIPTGSKGTRPVTPPARILRQTIGKVLEIESSDRRQLTFRVVSHTVRPKLSAILQAKRSGMNPQDDHVPPHLSLPAIITAEAAKTSLGWRKQAIDTIMRIAHKGTISNMEKSGVPLYWPRELGGWGLPPPKGKPVAPAKFRKAAASILNGQSQLRRDYMRVFQLARAPKHLRKIIRDQLTIVDNLPERLSDEAEPKPLEEVEGEVIARTLAYHSFDPFFDKRSSLKIASVDTVAKHIKRVLAQGLKKWQSAKPIDSSKAVKLLEQKPRLVDRKEINRILFYTGTPDSKSTYSSLPGPVETVVGDLKSSLGQRIDDALSQIRQELQPRQSPDGPPTKAVPLSPTGGPGVQDTSPEPQVGSSYTLPPGCTGGARAEDLSVFMPQHLRNTPEKGRET